MSCFIRLFLCLTPLIALLSCAAKKNQSVIVERGDIIYTYETEVVQCVSQKSYSGKIAILIKSLNKNTRIADINLCFTKENNYFVKILMKVKQEKKELENMTDCHEILLPIEPTYVPQITLKGTSIIEHENVTVLIPSDFQFNFDNN